MADKKNQNKFKTSMDVALDVIGGKWKLTILCQITDKPKRTSELLRSIPRISQRMLIKQLKELERDFVVNRKSYHEIPPRVEYSLTEYGKSLIPIMQSLSAWGAKHALEIYPKQNIAFEVANGFDDL